MSDTVETEPSSVQEPRKVAGGPTGPAAAAETVMVPGERRALAEAVVRRRQYWSAGAGVIPLPGLDLLAIVGIQTKLLQDLARIYDVPFDRVRVKALIGAILGGLLPFGAAAGVGGLAGWLYKGLPGVGPVLTLATVPVAAAATNKILGRLFIEHFESGGTLLDFDAEKMRARFRAEMDGTPTSPAAA